jgi:TonB family protein
MSWRNWRLAMKRTAMLFTVIPALVLLTGCVQEKVPTVHTSEFTPANESPVYFAWEEAPKLIKVIKPQYPEIAREDGVEGKVVVTLIVDEKGDVIQAKVMTSEPASIFDDAALTAVRQYKFEPAKSHGKAIKVQLGHTIIFTLASRK